MLILQDPGDMLSLHGYKFRWSLLSGQDLLLLGIGFSWKSFNCCTWHYLFGLLKEILKSLQV